MNSIVFIFAILIVIFSPSVYSTTPNETSHDTVTRSEISDCQATYFPKNGKLLLPCVDLVDAAGNIQSYQAMMERLATSDSLQFVVKSSSANLYEFKGAAEFDCRATYFLEQGKLFIPCVDIVTIPKRVEFHEAIMELSSPVGIEPFVFVVTDIDGMSVLEQPSLPQEQSSPPSKPSVRTSYVPAGTNQVTVSVYFFANNIGEVTSIPDGLRCKGEKITKNIAGNYGVIFEKTPCSAQFNAGSTVTLTATPFSYTGNHFVGWKGDCKGTNRTCTLKLTKDVTVQAIFKIERCFGAVGPGCGSSLLGVLSDDSFDSTNKYYPNYPKDEDSDIAVGSIQHDLCCLKNPQGHWCGFDDSQPNKCRIEWDKAFNNKCGGRVWHPNRGFFGPYKANEGDPINWTLSNIPSRLKAPEGTRLDLGDQSYCASGQFKSTGDEPYNIIGAAACWGIAKPLVASPHTGGPYGICGKNLPRAVADTAITSPGTPIKINVLNNDYPGDTPSKVTIGSSPQKGTTAISADGTITYTPKLVTANTDTFTYIITDKDGDIGSATVTVTIRTLLPQARNDTATTSPGRSININVLGNDIQGDAPAKVKSVSSGRAGTVTINPDGTVRYTPRAGATGDAFQYTITDRSGDTSTATVTVTIMLPCNATAFTKSGGDGLKNTYTVPLNGTSGSFNFSYDTYGVKDKIVVKYEGRILYDTGCVGKSEIKTLSYAGSSSAISVEVTPNCEGTSGTGWIFSVSCPQ